MTAVELPLIRRQGFVDGSWVDADSGETFPVTNPANKYWAVGGIGGHG